MKRMLSILGAFCLLLTILPLSAAAELMNPAEAWRIPAQVNPLYAHTLDQETLEAELDALPKAAAPMSTEYVSVEEAIQQVRDQMKVRNTGFTINVKTTDNNLGPIISDIFYSALEHTGVPTEGDYLAWQYGGWGVGDGLYYYWEDDSYHLSIPYTVMYYSNTEQEAAMDQAVAELLEELDLDGKSDYEKVCGIYDFITATVVYDHYNLERDPNYLPMYTAYGALIDEAAVCQGYANLFYRLALELGVDNRIVTGYAGGPHAWNLVGIDGTYYYVDATWDAGYTYYQYFLLGSDEMAWDHTADPDHAAFLEDYNISTLNYFENLAEQEAQALEWEALAETNRERHKAGLEPVTTNEGMSQSADIRAAELTEYLDHVRPDQTDWWTVFSEVGVPFSGAAENIASGYRTAATVVEGWMNSDGHRENLLDASHAHVGLGYEWVEYDRYGAYWAQLFCFTSYCAYSNLEVFSDPTTVENGTALEELQLWAKVQCVCCGDCYLPILPEYCEGYSPNRSGVQNVTVSCLGLTATVTITVEGEEEDIVYGDANLDSEINGKDLILLRQRLAGWDVTLVEAAADCNADGTVNGKDLILLRQHLAGWDVVLGPQPEEEKNPIIGTWVYVQRMDVGNSASVNVLYMTYRADGSGESRLEMWSNWDWISPEPSDHWVDVTESNSSESFTYVLKGNKLTLTYPPDEDYGIEAYTVVYTVAWNDDGSMTIREDDTTYKPLPEEGMTLEELLVLFGLDPNVP